MYHLETQAAHMKRISVSVLGQTLSNCQAEQLLAETVGEIHTPRAPRYALRASISQLFLEKWPNLNNGRDTVA